MPSSEVMSKWKSGKLHSGSKSGPKVKSQKQAVAIMLSEKRAEAANGGKYPERAFGGAMMPPNGMMPQMGMGAPMGSVGVAPGQMMPGQTMPSMPTNPLSQPLGISGGQVMPTTPRPLAVGGVATPGVGNFDMAKRANVNPSPIARSQERQVMHGPVMSAVAGRTDAHKVAVPSGSYVVPADVVSGRGQGNTAAGMNVLQKLFKMGPYGSPGGSIKRGNPFPKAMQAPKMLGVPSSRGGRHDKHVGHPVPVNLAGGELVVPPENLTSAVHPDLKTAHEIMDKWVVSERKNLRKTLGKLPGPVKS